MQKIKKERPETMAMLAHLLWIRKHKRRDKFVCVLSGGRMSNENFEKYSELVNELRNGK